MDPGACLLRSSVHLSRQEPAIVKPVSTPDQDGPKAGDDVETRYEPPSLVRLGTLADLTLGLAVGVGDGAMGQAGGTGSL
jgi:hypothetical protein